MPVGRIGIGRIKNAYLESLVAAALTHAMPYRCPAPQRKRQTPALETGARLRLTRNPKGAHLKLGWRRGSAERITKTCFSYSAACLTTGWVGVGFWDGRVGVWVAARWRP